MYTWLHKLSQNMLLWKLFAYTTVQAYMARRRGSLIGRQWTSPVHGLICARCMQKGGMRDAVLVCSDAHPLPCTGTSPNRMAVHGVPHLGPHILPKASGDLIGQRRPQWLWSVQDRLVPCLRNMASGVPHIVSMWQPLRRHCMPLCSRHFS